MLTHAPTVRSRGRHRNRKLTDPACCTPTRRETRVMRSAELEQTSLRARLVENDSRAHCGVGMASRRSSPERGKAGGARRGQALLPRTARVAVPRTSKACAGMAQHVNAGACPSACALAQSHGALQDDITFPDGDAICARSAREGSTRGAWQRKETAYS